MQQQQASYEYRYHYLEVVNDSEATETHELTLVFYTLSYLGMRYIQYVRVLR
jgi:hypothetical protein